MEITIESFATTTGVALTIGIILQAVNLMAWSLSTQWIRRIALILGIVLVPLVAWSAGGPPAAANVVMFYLVAAVNGIVAGLAAGAGYDTIKYGTARSITSR
jgi:hypothetical protein